MAIVGVWINMPDPMLELTEIKLNWQDQVIYHLTATSWNAVRPRANLDLGKSYISFKIFDKQTSMLNLA